ncbi:MAG: VOC family protein, partial [Nocardioidaceae bacterium]|nr:VOC family protein [Nocardioidaceae bacterium]
VPADLITADVLEARSRIDRLDLAHAKERYGATTPGGVGISVPASH